MKKIAEWTKVAATPALFEAVFYSRLDEIYPKESRLSTDYLEHASSLLLREAQWLV